MSNPKIQTKPTKPIPPKNTVELGKIHPSKSDKKENSKE